MKRLFTAFLPLFLSAYMGLAQAPTFQTLVVAAGNGSATLTFNQGVAGNAGGTQALAATDFAVSVSASSGGGTVAAGAVTVTVTHTAAASTATLTFTIAGVKDGSEVLTVKPSGNNNIYSTTGTVTPMASTASITANLKDQLAPSGYTVAINQSFINNSNKAAIGFTFSGAEVGTTYNYSFTDPGAVHTVSGSGTIATTTDAITGIDLTALNDGLVTLSVTLTDVASNVGSAATDSKTKDVVAPTGYSVSIDQSFINNANKAAISFTFSGAQVGATYNYAFTDVGAAHTVNGTGTIATATDQITGINLSTLNDGSVTLTVTLTDPAGNQGSNATNVKTKDVVAPTGYSVTIDQSYINNSNKGAISFTFAGAVVGTTYNYAFTDAGAAHTVSGTGTIATATDQITGVNLATLNDGTVTLTVTLTDAAGNQGANATNTKTKDVAAPTGYSVTIDQSAINIANKAAISFTFAGAEVGATYNYAFTDVGAAHTVSGTGTIATATDQITGVDLTALNDGTVTLTVSLTDPAGNQGANATNTKTKDTVAPSVQTATYSKPYVKNTATELITLVFTENLSVAPKIALSGPVVVAATTMTGATGQNTFTYSSTSWAGNGTETISLTVGTDAAGNPVVSPSSNNTFIVDNTAPTAVTITQAVGQTDPEYGNTVNFQLVFANGPIDGATFAASDITKSGTATFTVGTPTTSDGGVTWNVACTVTASGTVVITTNTNTVSDLAGNTSGSIASTNTDNSVTTSIDPTNPSSITPTAGTPANASISLAKAGPTSSRYFVVMKAGSAVTFVPSDGNTYSGSTPNLNFSSAADLGGGEKLVFYGTGASFPLTITGLAPSTQYYFALYAENDTGGGANPNFAPTAVTANLTTAACSYPTVPTVGSVTSNTSSITIPWSRSLTSDGALVIITQGGASSYLPVDGVDYSSGYIVNTSGKPDFTKSKSIGTGTTGTDGIVVFSSASPSNNVAQSVQVVGLTPGTSYTYAIYTYNTSTFCYQRTSAPTGSKMTTTTYAAEMTVLAGPAVEPDSISSMGTALSSAVLPQKNAVQNFDFEVSDAGGDGSNGYISQIVIYAGPNNTVSDWSQVISAVMLSDNYGNSQTTNITVGVSSITIASINTATLGLIPDGDNPTVEIYTLTVALKNPLPAGIDHKQFDFKVSSSLNSITASASGSGMAVFTDVTSGYAKNRVKVDATKIVVSTQPTTNPVATVPLTQQPKFTAEDANGNIDTYGFNYALTVNAGSLSPTSAPANFTNGVADFTGSGFYFNGTGTNVPMSVTANSITSANTNNITCTSTTTLGTASVGLAVSPLNNSTPAQAVFGFTLQTDGASTTANVTITTSVDPTTVMGNFKLYGNSTDDFSTATNLGLTASTTSSSVGFTNIAINSTIKYFYLVGDVNAYFVVSNPSIQFSLNTSGLSVGVSGSTLAGSTPNTNYNFNDFTPPTITQVINSQPVINEINTIQTVKVVFSEPMNTSFSPFPSDLSMVVNGATGTGSFAPAILVGWSQTNAPNDTYTLTVQHIKSETFINNSWSWFNAPSARKLQDLNSNFVPSASSTSTVFTIDNQKPTATASTNLTVLNIANNTIRLSVKYSEGMDATQVPTINYSGGTLGSGVAVSGAGYTNGWKTTTNTNDTYEIDYTDNATEDAGNITFTANGAYDFYGNVQTTVGASNSFYVDRVTPTISSVSRVTSTPTHATSLSYSVAYSEAMSNITSSSVTPHLISTTSGSPSAGTFSGSSGSNPVTFTIGSVVGDGVVGIDVNANGTNGSIITDSHGNPLLTSLASAAAGQYTVDQTPPVIKKIDPINVNGYASSVNGVTVTSQLGYKVHFSEPVNGLAFSDFNGYKLPNTASVININPGTITSVNSLTYDSVWQLNATYSSGAGTFEVDFNPKSNSSGPTFYNGLNGIDFLVDGNSAGNYYAYDHQSFITGYGASASDFQNLQTGSEVYVMGGQYLGTVTSLDTQSPPRWFYFTPNNTYFSTFSNQSYTYTKPSTVISSTSGNLTSSLGSNTITGVGTSFTTEVLKNDLIFDGSGTVFIGIVSNISSNTSLSFNYPARASFSGSFTIHRPPQTFNTTAIADPSGNSVTPSSLAGKYANFCKPEPAGAVTVFNASPASGTTITATWTDVSTADHYLVMLRNPSGTFPTVADGGYLADDTDLTDGLLKWNVKQSLQIVTFSGLTAGVNYELIIYPYTLDDNNIVGTDHSAIDYNVNTPATTSVASALVHSFTYPQNIDYATTANQKATITTTADGTQIEQFTLQDGGASNNDQDTKNTILETISLTFSNAQDIKQVALFDGSNSLLASSKPLVGGAVTFGTVGSPLISATDNTNATIKVYVTFNSTVTDHDVINVQVTGATVASTNTSAFKIGASSIPMTAQSYPNNGIEVFATKLAFTSPGVGGATVSLNTVYNNIVVVAEDGNGNKDIDYDGAASDKLVSFTTNPSGVAVNYTPDPNTIKPSFTAGVLDFTQAVNGLTGLNFTSGNNNETFTITITSTASAKTNPTALTGTSPTFTLAVATDSYVYFDPNFAVQTFNKFLTQNAVSMPTTNANAATNIATMAKLFLSDGGAAKAENPLFSSNGVYKPGDTDGAGTTISGITFSITGAGAGDIKLLALYDSAGNQLGSTATSPGSTASFSGFTLKANKNDTAAFTLRGTFNSSIGSDQDQITFKVSSVTWSAGSQIYQTNPPPTNTPIAPYVGGVNTGSTSKTNTIDVIATSLDFSSGVDQPSSYAGYNPSPVGTDPAGSKAGTVTARDAVGNVDKNFVSGTITVTDGNGIAISPPSGGFVFGNMLSSSPGVMDLTGMLYNSVGNGKVRVQTSNPSAVSPIPTSLDSNTPSGVSNACNSVQVINTTVEYNSSGILSGNGGKYNLKGGLSGNAIFGLNFTAQGSNGTDPILKTFTIGFKTGPSCTNNCGNNWFYSTNNGTTVIFDPTTLDVTLGGVSVKGNGGTVTAVSSASAGAGNYDQIKVDLTGYINSNKLLTSTALNAILFVDVSNTTSGTTPTLRPYLVDLGYSDPSESNVTVSNGSAYSVAYDAQAPVVYTPKFDGSAIPVVRYEGEIDGVEYSFASATPPILLADKGVYPTTKTSPYTAQPNVNPANPWFDPNGTIPSPGIIYNQTSTSPTGSPAFPRLVLQFNTGVATLDNPMNPNTPTGHVYDSLNNIVADLFLDTLTTYIDQTNATYKQAKAVIGSNGQIVKVYSYLVFNLTAPGQLNTPATSLNSDAVYYVNIAQGSYDPSGHTQSGISDQQLNFFGGVSDKSTLYFKTWTTTAPTASNVSSSYNVSGLGTLTATFDQLGTAYFVVKKNPSTTPVSTNYVINPNVPNTGTITATTGSTAVVGVGTLFTTELVVGSIIQDASGTVVGKVQSITDDLNLVLTSTAAINVSGASYTSAGSANLTNSFSIQNVGIPQTIQFPTNAIFAAGSSYDVYIVTTNNATPVKTSSVQVFKNAISSVAALPPTTFTPNAPAYNICGNSYTYLTQPMVIAEKTKGNFQKAGTQIINILLPPGYEFDTKPTYPPQVNLGPSGFTDFTGIATTSFTSNSVMQIQFQNTTASYYDVISISNLRVIGKKDAITGALPSSGYIYWYYGNDAMTNAGNTPLKIADINVTTPIKGPDFTNSYWTYNNGISPYHISLANDPTGAAQNLISQKVNAIPDNYGTQVTLQPISSTFPIKPPPYGEDYLASTFSGTGVSGSVLTLAGTTLDAAFNIIMSHTDNNGCAYTKTEQYVVYKHASPISTKLGVTANLNPASNLAFTAGTVQDIVNTNFNQTNPTANAIVPSVPINYGDKAGYKLLELQADLPVIEIDSNKYSKHWKLHPNDSMGTQLMTGYEWRKLIRSLPVTTPITGGNSYSWDYAKILNAGSTIVQDPILAKQLIRPLSVYSKTLDSTLVNNVYDYFAQLSPNNTGNYWWKGGSLGKIEFTGIYQSTADPSVYAPFRQDVELFIPSVPIIEVQSSNGTYDNVTNTNAKLDNCPVPTLNSKQYTNYLGTATFCEFGGQISLVAYPQAAGGTSDGKFAIYDYSTYDWTNKTGTSLGTAAPNSAFVDNGNGTMTLAPYLLNNSNVNVGIANSYKDILVTYTYQDNNSPAVGVGYLVIRVTPNPVPAFAASSVVSSPGASNVDALCVGSQITFSASNSTIGNAPSVSTNRDYISKYGWDFGDPNSGNSNIPQSPDATSPTGYSKGGPGGTAIDPNYIQPLTPSSQTYDAPVHIFSASSTYTVNLNLTSNWGCPSLPIAPVSSSYPSPSVFASSTAQIAVGQNPVPNFDVGNNCAGDPIHFYAGPIGSKQNSYVPAGGPGGQVINQYNWDYNYQTPVNPLPDPTPKNQPLTVAYGAQTTYQANAPGFYNVNLSTITSLGCEANITKSIAQLPLQNLPIGTAYQEYFDGANGGWLPLNLSGPTPSAGGTSWVYDSPSGKWTIAQNYAANEKSALYSACLNLSTIARPVISYDGYFNLNNGEGIVMQYSTDTLNIQDPQKTWIVLGSNATGNSPGLDWYNKNALPSNPGTGYPNSTNSTGYGWNYTDNGPSYTHPKHKLEDVGTNSRVILRLALGTINGPVANSTTAGFTLDSVRVGSRTRTVLFENFTTANAGADITINGDIKADADSISAFVKKNINNTQLVNINYHVGFLGNDPFNLTNSADPGSRVLYYGVKQVPYAFLDGVHYQNNNPPYRPNPDLFENWGKGAYDLQTLKLARADFGLNTLLGTISANTSSPSITGVGTIFLTELTVGAVIRNSMGAIIGTVRSITNNTTLTLSSNALINVSGGLCTTASSGGPPNPTTVYTDTNDGSIHVDVNVTPLVDMPYTTTALHVMVLEDTIIKSNLLPLTQAQLTTNESQFEYVLRKMLPDGVGTKFPANTFVKPTLVGTTLTPHPVHLGPNGAVNDASTFKWIMDKPLDPLANKKFTVVVFLQDEVTKEVYQAELYRNIPYPSSTITGIEPTIENLKVFPNPADQELTITLPSPAKETMNVRMANQLGEFTELGSFAEGEQTKTIKTGALTAGVYILQMGSSNSAMRTKVIIVH